MAVVCKITLDASEYRRELAAVVEESRAAAQSMSAGASGGGSKLSVTADTSAAEQAIDELAANPVEIEAEVTADSSVAENALATIADAAPEVETVVSADTAPAQGALARLKQALAGLMGGNVGEQISKGGSAIGAIGALAGASIPPVGALGAVVSALLSPVALITAAITALVAIGSGVFDLLTVSAEEFEEQTKRASKAAEEHAEKVRKESDAAQSYMERLRELNTLEEAGNSTKAETASLIQALEQHYGDLGAEIDATTGRVKNLLEVEQKLNAERGRRMGKANAQQSDAYLQEAKASFTKAKGSEWFTTEVTAADMFDSMAETHSLEQLQARLEELAKNATTSEQITGYHDAAEKVKAAIEARNRAANSAATGYETSEEYQQALTEQLGRQGNAQHDRDAARQNVANRQSDDAFNDLRSLDSKDSAHVYEEKKANRQRRIDAEQAERRQLEAQLEEAKAAVSQADESGDEMARARALTAQYEIEKQIQNSLDKEYALKRQITELDKQRAEAAANLKRSLGDQAFDLYGQALNAAGRGREFEEQKALRDAERTKGYSLTDEEREQVKTLSQLSYSLANRREMQIGETEIKSNSLTARGGFSGGAKMPDSEKINREIAQTGKQQLEQIQKIAGICERLGAF